MGLEIRITEAALADLEEILDYSSARFPETTEQFGTAILDHLEVLRSFPLLGRPVTGRTGVRVLVHTPISIFYRVRERSRVIEVLRFWHASRASAPV